jgi:malonate-semialdehyde dehydrogenase (acetylating)/methylmalonate-semialdehyde dehydrogenase
MQKYFVEKVPNFVGGEWVESAATTWVPIHNPATGDAMGSVPMGTAGDVDAAVAAAKRAFPSWSETPPAARSRYLFELRNLMQQNYDELLSICTQEHGKTIEESKGDVFRGIENVETGCGIPQMMQGIALENVSSGIDCVSYRQPMGVFAVIAPYNFPSMVPLWFLPYCIATGNTMVVKPSEQVPFSQKRLFDLIAKLKLPAGVVNCVNGGRDVVNAILEHKDIVGVSFVGSSPVAEHVYTRCGATGKRAQALGGAKNFTFVSDKCDWDKTVANIVDSAFGCAGQRCLATAVAVGLGKSTTKELRERLMNAVKRIKVGEGHQQGVTMGPVISAKHREKVLGYVETGLKEGAKLLTDGRGTKVEGFPNGHWVGPTLFDAVDAQMTIAREEIFGPVLSILETNDIEHAISIAKDHPLANAASIYTQDGSEARKFVHEIDASMVGVNIGVAAPMAYFGFGGNKRSFFGDLRGHGREQVQFYTQTKTAIQRWW